MPSLFSSPSVLNDLLSDLQDVSIEDELPRSPSPECAHSDLWSDTEQYLAQTQLERSGQTYDSESDIADDSDHPHPEFLRCFGVLKSPCNDVTKYAPTPENSPEVDLSSGRMVYGLGLNEPSLSRRDGEVTIVNLSSKSYKRTINDRNGSQQDHVGQVLPVSPHVPPTTPMLHVRHAIIPSATGPTKDVGRTSRIPSATSVKSLRHPIDPHETSKILPSSIAGFGQVVETTRVQPKRPVPVFSPQITKTFATTRRRRAIHPLEEPCPPLTPLALTPKLGQPQACSSPFGGAVLFGT